MQNAGQNVDEVAWRIKKKKHRKLPKITITKSMLNFVKLNKYANRNYQ